MLATSVVGSKASIRGQSVAHAPACTRISARRALVIRAAHPGKVMYLTDRGLGALGVPYLFTMTTTNHYYT